MSDTWSDLVRHADWLRDYQERRAASRSADEQASPSPSEAVPAVAHRRSRPPTRRGTRRG